MSKELTEQLKKFIPDSLDNLTLLQFEPMSRRYAAMFRQQKVREDSKQRCERSREVCLGVS